MYFRRHHQRTIIYHLCLHVMAKTSKTHMNGGYIPSNPPKKSPDVMFSKNIQKHWGAPTLCLSSPFVPAGHEWREPRQKCGAWTTKRSWVMYGYVGLMDWRWVPYSSISFYRKLTSPDIFCPPNNLGVSRNRVHWKWPVNLSFSWLTWLDCDPLWPIVTAPWPAQIWLSQPVAISLGPGC